MSLLINGLNQQSLARRGKVKPNNNSSGKSCKATALWGLTDK